MNRVVVTGMSAISPIGHDWDTVAARLKGLQSGIQRMEDWARYDGLNTQVAAPVTDFEKPAHYSRKAVRSMGRVALMSTCTAERALDDAGLLGDAWLKSGDVGVSFGSSAGTPEAIHDFGTMISELSTEGITANTYLKMMSHTAPVNIGIFFGLQGRVYTTSSACTSGSQGIGYAYEAIRAGQQKAMIAGGSEELSASAAAVFDTLFATSTLNDQPSRTPKPFDAHRDGLVVGEGAAALVLEELEHARARGARIYAEIIGYGTNSDGAHVTQPNRSTMARAMRLALADQDTDPASIGYVSAHGTATDRGDVAESCATRDVFERAVPISSLKSYTGHTLGACGALEAWSSVHMLNEGWFHPTLNLSEVDPECGELDYIQGAAREIDCSTVMSNNFAFGGINTSLIFRKLTS